MSLGHALLETGDYAAARSRYEEGLALRRAAGTSQRVAWALLAVGHAAWLQGERGVTQSRAREALALFQETGATAGLLAVLESLGVAALAEGRKERAARLMGAYRRQTGGYPLSLQGATGAAGGILPADPFTGQALRYRREGNGYLLYSVGVNGRDDGGRGREPRTPVAAGSLAGQRDDIAWRARGTPLVLLP